MTFSGLNPSVIFPLDRDTQRFKWQKETPHILKSLCLGLRHTSALHNKVSVKSFRPFSTYDGSILTLKLLLAGPGPWTSVTLGIRCIKEHLGIFCFKNPGTFEDNCVLTRWRVRCSKLNASRFPNQPSFLQKGSLFGNSYFFNPNHLHIVFWSSAN